jgi:hypothetical protein
VLKAPRAVRDHPEREARSKLRKRREDVGEDAMARAPFECKPVRKRFRKRRVVEALRVQCG